MKTLIKISLLIILSIHIVNLWANDLVFIDRLLLSNSTSTLSLNLCYLEKTLMFLEVMMKLFTLLQILG